jgi:hypothetical protein
MKQGQQLFNVARGAMAQVAPFWMKEALPKQTSKEVWKTVYFSQK